MEENTETVKEPQYLIQDLCDQIKQLTKKKLNKIQSEINKSTNLSTGVIRKYEGEISKNKPELFLIGCVEVAEKKFVKEQESIAFPEKPLDPGGRPATEKEEGVRYKQMHMKSAFDDGSQRIDPEAEICVSTDDIDTGKITVVGIFKHGTPP